MKTEILPAARRHMPEVSPEAVDEIFAGLARRAFEAEPLRDLAADLDRQHERLRQLLNDIDSVDASE
jgi:hypothetical protein